LRDLEHRPLSPSLDVKRTAFLVALPGITAVEHHARDFEDLAKQRALPIAPYLGRGALHVRECQKVQHGETLDVPAAVREGADEIVIRDVAPLRDVAHREVLLNEPHEIGGIFFGPARDLRSFEALADRTGDVRTLLRVIVLGPALPDV